MAMSVSERLSNKRFNLKICTFNLPESRSMACIDETAELANYEIEDISDVIVKLEKSFRLQFEKDAFYNVNTFGDLCDVFDSHMKYRHINDCTKQQAFYRVRKAISIVQGINQDQIKPDSNLADLFPPDGRRKKAKAFKNYVGADIKLLTYPDWLALLFTIGFVLSLIAFFVDWKIALSGIALFITAFKAANYWGKELSLQTVRDLTEKLTKEHYIDMRRAKETVNSKEVSDIIIETFSNHLAIDKNNLTRAAKFSWAE